MTHVPHQHSGRERARELPEGYEAPLRALDQRLDAFARHHCAAEHMPAGLTEAIARASSPLLPSPGRLRLVGTAPARQTPGPVRIPALSRLAMAASVALAFVVGHAVLTSGPTSGDRLADARAGAAADRSVPAEPSAMRSAAVVDASAAWPALSPEAEALLLDSTGLDHVIARRTTYDDLALDLAAVFDEMEM